MPYPGGKHGPGHYLGGGGGAGGVITLPNGATVTPGAVVSAENEAGTTQVPGVGGIGDIAYVYGNINYSLSALHPSWSLVFGLGTPFQWMRKVLTGGAADDVFLSAGVQRVVIAGMFALSGAVGAFAAWTGSASLGAFGLTGSYNLQNIFFAGAANWFNRFGAHPCKFGCANCSGEYGGICTYQRGRSARRQRFWRQCVLIDCCRRCILGGGFGHSGGRLGGVTVGGEHRGVFAGASVAYGVGIWNT